MCIHPSDKIFPKFFFDFLIFKIFELRSLTQHHKISATLQMRPRALVAIFVIATEKEGCMSEAALFGGTFSGGECT